MNGNDLGGYQYTDLEQKGAALRVRLVTLPKESSGANCENCRWSVRDEKKGLFCENSLVELPVAVPMICQLWSNDEALESWR